MQRFTANTILNDRMLLKEELSFDTQNGQQVWTVQDQQTGQSLIARFHGDGRVDWFNDNRAPVEASPPPTQPRLSPAPPTAAVAPQPPGKSRPVAAPTSQQIISFLTVMVVLGLVALGYVYRKPLITAIRSLRPPEATQPDSALRTPTDSPPVAGQPETAPAPAKATSRDRRQPAVAFRSDIGPDGEPTTERPTRTPTTSPNKARIALVSARQMARLLNLMKRIPAWKHPAIFADARRAFTELRQAGGRSVYIDSLYSICLGRGTQSMVTYRQNGDPVSRRYAAEWYQTAHALKPNPAVEQQISWLRSNEPKPRSEPARRPVRKNESLFMTDPEVNHD